jgi:hypothetical protein
MQIGLAVLADREMLTQINAGSLNRRNPDAYFDSVQRTLPSYAASGWLLGAAQFRGVPTDGSAGTIVDEQALGMMLYFYRRFGTGPVVETLQRLGSGQGWDEALVATTGLNEEQFFTQWYQETVARRR